MNAITQLLSIFNPSFRRAQRAAVSSRYWVRWQYSEEEWRRLDELDWARTKRWFYGTLIFFGLVTPLWWALMLLFVWPHFVPVFESTSWQYKAWTVFVLIVGVISVAFIVIGEVKAYRSGKARHIERQNPGASREIEIGPLDICQSGKCIPLVGLNLRLTSVSTDPNDPSLLRFTLMRGRGIPSGISIPIPQGSEAVAQQLIQRFTREIVL